MQDRQARIEEITFKTENGKIQVEDGAPPRRPTNFIPLTAVTPRSAPRLDLATVRARLAGQSGQQYWRSLEELSDDPDFQELLQREFPRQAPRDWAPLSRRDFLKFMGAGLALAGLSGCAYQPAEKIVPYVKQPENLVPGKPLFFATASTVRGYALGVLAESHMGRPTKIEGNPDHPASLGATDVFAQASVLTIYDPDRSQTLRKLGDISTWDAFLGEMTGVSEMTSTGGVPNTGGAAGATGAMGVIQRHRANRGAGLRVLTEGVTSPTLASQLQALQRTFPEARVHSYEPVNRDNVHAGARLAFGVNAQPLYHFDRAKVILSLDSDFLLEEPNSVRYARDFISGRRVRKGKTDMNRLYVVESTPTITGAMADHHLPLRSSEIEGFTRALAQQLGVAGITGSTSADAKWIAALADDLRNSGAGLVVPGFQQPAIVHAIAHAINEKLGSVGTAVVYTAPVEVSSLDQATSLSNLVADMNAGRVETLIILGGNPVYNAPYDLKFTAALDRVPLRIHHGLYEDETSVRCHWHVPNTHYLEAWSDARAYDGTVSIVQPLIQPLYDSHSVHEVMAVFLGGANPPGYDVVRGVWQDRLKLSGDAFEKWWRKAIHDGIVPNTAVQPLTVRVTPNFAATAAPAANAATGMEIVFRPDPSVWDGRFANNGWLQETPRPLTKLTWDNVAMLSPATAEANKLETGDIVEVTYRGNKAQIPVWVMPGHANDSVTVHLGYGRTRAGKLGTGVGRCNAYALRSTTAPWFGTGLEMRKTGETYELANTQHHHLIDARTPQEGEGTVDTTFDRGLIRSGSIEAFKSLKEGEHFLEEGHGEGEHLSMYPPEWPSDSRKRGVEASGLARGTVETERGELVSPNQWGMVVDINACIGCNACVVACQAENNIPVVGKDQVERGREMNWLRIDTYYKGDLDDPQAYFQPVMCMHCENAPCEPVCPVEATSHSAEGINEMTYNRCIGTRYCSNNCPYKVRRFNYLQYTEQQSPVIQLMHNPDVTVRSRGVMEKCTYCIQRINNGRIEAEKEGRHMLNDGEVLTACQQSCPTEAIIFGNIKDRKSQVAGLKAEPHNYGLLTELNTEPRTTYLARLRNPNPVLEPAAAAPHSGGHAPEETGTGEEHR